jgi:hypothetical protein
MGSAFYCEKNRTETGSGFEGGRVLGDMRIDKPLLRLRTECLSGFHFSWSAEGFGTDFRFGVLTCAAYASPALETTSEKEIDVKFFSRRIQLSRMRCEVNEWEKRQFLALRFCCGRRKSRAVGETIGAKDVGGIASTFLYLIDRPGSQMEILSYPLCTPRGNRNIQRRVIVQAPWA